MEFTIVIISMAILFIFGRICDDGSCDDYHDFIF